jgi:Zn-dependent protease with chaperone function
MLTKDNQAMISALRKISKKPEVYVSNTQVAALFTVNPLDDILEIFQTHPSIENRIKALENY